MGLFLGISSGMLSSCSEGGPETTLELQAETASVFPTARRSSQAPARSREIAQSRATAIVEAAERVAPAVVSINTARTEQVRTRSFFTPFVVPRRTQSLGSGFVVSAEGHILTNDHVVRGADEILVTLPDGRDFTATKVGEDQLTDVAVLKIEGSGLPVAALGTSDGLMIGEWAIAIGNPFGNLFSNTEPSVTAGVISAVDRHIVPGDDDQVVYLGMIQTDASINPGNSGGPLVNSLGEVIGVNSSIFSRSGGSEGLGFAIPIDRALRIADDLIRLGEVRRAWPGFDVEAGERDRFGRTRGVVVGGVDETSVAAGSLRPGDRIVSLNGNRLVTPLDFEAELMDLRPGDDLNVEVEGRPGPLRLTVADLPSVTAERVTFENLMELVTVTTGIQRERNLVRAQGALVTSIDPRLQRVLRLREGDVILQINRTAITSAEQTTRLLARVSGRVVIYFERDGEVFLSQFRI
jgi:serine protease Do